MSQPNPYEADPQKIPPSDPYREEPMYGRYLPAPTDFSPDSQHINSAAPESLTYWISVLCMCTSSNRIYDNETGGRDVFALGSVIIKSTHLKGALHERDHTLADANEVAATRLASSILGKIAIRTPRIYFAGKLQGRSVLVQERIAGVGLNVAWRYLSASDKQSFKEQARDILKALSTVNSSDYGGRPGYVVPDPNPVANRGIQQLEREILSADGGDSPKSSCVLMHNDLSQSNLIVDRGRILAVVDWEMAGWFSWEKAREVHRRIRSPSEKSYAHLNLPQEVLDDIYFWNDLYG